jgi:hypothetical protein
MAGYSQTDLDAIADQLNGRPRQTLGWMTPSQKLEQALHWLLETAGDTGRLIKGRSPAWSNAMPSLHRVASTVCAA